MSVKKLNKIEKITGKIEVLSGLHIGAGSEEIHIGGIDNPVVRNPVSGNPYIPGSSIKGKIRCLLELVTNRVKEEGGPFSTDDSNDPIARIFGNGKVDDKYEGGPTRVAFSDCQMENAEFMVEKEALTEEKVEVAINRINGKASPRHMERVPRGAEFNFEFTYKIFDCDGDNGNLDKKNLVLLLIGIKLLESDALGGSGSRGYGRIKFHLDELPDYIGYENLDEIDIETEVKQFIKKD